MLRPPGPRRWLSRGRKRWRGLKLRRKDHVAQGVEAGAELLAVGLNRHLG